MHEVLTILLGIPCTLFVLIITMGMFMPFLEVHGHEKERKQSWLQKQEAKQKRELERIRREKASANVVPLTHARRKAKAKAS